MVQCVSFYPKVGAMKKQCVIILIGLFVMGAMGESDEYEAELYRDALNFVHECGSRSITFCFKERVLKYVERLPGDLDLGGLRIKKTSANIESLSRNRQEWDMNQLPEDENIREQIIDAVLLERIGEYFSTHRFEIQMPRQYVNELSKSAEEGRKRKGGNKGGGDDHRKNYTPLMLLFQLKFATLAAIALKSVALIAFKALVLAKVALTISVIIGLKKLVDQKHTSTYEVVAAHPHYEDLSHADRAFKETTSSAIRASGN